MLLMEFLRNCELFGIAVDKAIRTLSEENVNKLGINLDLNYVSHMRKAMAVRKLTSLADIVKIDKAIKELRRNGETVDFPQVAERAGVTDPTVRKYFGEEIKRLRLLSANPGAKMATLPTRQKSASDESKDVMIAAIRKKNREVKDENKVLKEENGVLTAEVIVLREEVARLKHRISALEKGD